MVCNHTSAATWTEFELNRWDPRDIGSKTWFPFAHSAKGV